MRRSPASALFLLVAACQQPATSTPQAPSVLSDADRAAIRAVVDSATARANAGDPDGYVRGYYAPDAIAMPPNGPLVQGHDALIEVMSAFPPTAEFDAEIAEIEGTAETAWVRGTFSLTMTPPGASAPVTDRGKYIEIWRKQADGSWRVMRDIFNSDLPAAAPDSTG